MMNEYYGAPSTPTSDYLAHYGIKGMKWGVRKAIDSSNQRALDRHYAKAQKKLKKLSDRADINIQKKKYDTWNGQAKKAAVSGGIGGAAGGALGSLHGIKSAAIKAAKKQFPPYSGENELSVALRNTPALRFLADGNVRKIVGGFTAAGALGGAIGSYAGKKLRASVYKKRMSPEGHAKAVAKRNAWDKEMKSAFKGTKYERVINQQRKEQDRQKQIQQGLKNWADAFEKHYQVGLSRGMTHEQAERYSNNHIAKNGFKPVKKSKRRK